MRHPRSAPLKQKASPQRSLRQLHPTTWPQTTRLPITLCHISDFFFLRFVFTCAYLLNFSSVHPVALFSMYLFYLNRAPSWLATVKLFPSVLPQFEAEPPWSKQAELCCEQLSHTEHVLWSLADGIPPTPNGSGVRAALTNNKLEQGEGKTTAISLFSSPASTLSGQENRSGERRTIGGGGWLVLKRSGGGLKGNNERRVYTFAHLVPIYSWQL